MAVAQRTSPTQAPSAAERRPLIVYDGECIYCQNYVRLLRLREAVGPVELLDARSDDPRVKQLWQKGYDLNEGMAFLYRGTVFHGAEAVHVLATMSTSQTWFNKMNRLILSRRWLAKTIYPAMKLGRRLTLFARGRSLLEKQ